MEIEIQSIHFDADKSLLEFVNKRVEKLGTFYNRIIDAEVYLKLEDTASLENKIAEVKLNLPGEQLFAKDTSKSFEESIDNSVESVRRQLKKFKEKNSH